MSCESINHIRIILMLSLIVGTGACTKRTVTLQPNQTMSEAELASDTAFFSTVLQAISDKPLRVDPRPLTTKVSFGAAQLAEVPDEVVEARAEVLKRLGITEIDATAPRNCASWLVLANSPPDKLEALSRGCPRDEHYNIVIVGTPRFGEAAWSKSPEDAEEEKRSGHWSAMVIEIGMSPNGSSRQFIDYVLKRSVDGRGWQFVKRRGLFVYD